MFTEYYYVIVMNYVECSFERSKRKYRLLWVRFPKNWNQLCFTVPSTLDIPIIERGDKVRLKLHFFTRGTGKQPQFSITAIEKIEE